MPLDLIVLNERQCYCLIILKCYFKDIAATKNYFQSGIDGYTINYMKIFLGIQKFNINRKKICLLVVLNYVFGGHHNLSSL